MKQFAIILITAAVVIATAAAVTGAGVLVMYQKYYAGRIVPGVIIGSVPVGGLTRAEAGDLLQQRKQEIMENGIRLAVDDEEFEIRSDDVELAIDVESGLNRAWNMGRAGSLRQRLVDVVRKPSAVIQMRVSFSIDEQSLDSEIGIIAQLVDTPGKDVRLLVQETSVSVLTDTVRGRMLDQDKVKAQIFEALENLDAKLLRAPLIDFEPQVNIDRLGDVKERAERIMVEPLKLSYNQRTFMIPRSQIGSWIISGYEGEYLVPEIDRQTVSVYVTSVAEQINLVPQGLKLNVVDGKVVDLVPAQTGEMLQEEQTIELIVGALEQRLKGEAEVPEIALPVIVEKPAADETAASLGITERLGGATTPFTGSPPNRIHNIKNGVKFLSGILIKPGEEFSTIKALGRIDNTTGYLPELVIKGNETIPEFGGGLCQVSTTLFRAVLDAGLPVTARRSHSYRVSYYEKDGDGNYIGPGLDATIYSPNPDLKFTNDTGSTILIQGKVVGDRITFELYGTNDGRQSEIDGPYTLSTLPAGDPIYTDTDTLAKGVVKQTEKSHPGGRAIATYKVTYADGTVNEQVFKSSYRRWPAKYLVGTRE